MSDPQQRTSRPGPISEELRPYVDRDESEAIDRLAEDLRADRPFPRAPFRAELRAHLRDLDRAQPAWQPRNLRRLVAAYAGSGFLLLVVAAIGVAGAGPLA